MAQHNLPMFPAGVPADWNINTNALGAQPEILNNLNFELETIVLGAAGLAAAAGAAVLGRRWWRDRNS